MLKLRWHEAIFSCYCNKSLSAVIAWKDGQYPKFKTVYKKFFFLSPKLPLEKLAHRKTSIFLWNNWRAYSKLCQTFKMEHLRKKLRLKTLIIFAKRSTSEVWKVSELASECVIVTCWYFLFSLWKAVRRAQNHCFSIKICMSLVEQFSKLYSFPFCFHVT